MASNIAKHGRKKSGFFSTLGFGRQNATLAAGDIPSIRYKDLPDNNPITHGVTGRGIAGFTQSRRNDSYEELASALLTDSTLSGNVAATSTSAKTAQYEVKYTRLPTTDGRKLPDGPQKSSKHIGDSSRGHVIQSSDAEIGNGADQKLQMSKTVALNPLGMNPPGIKLSISAPINPVKLTAEPVVSKETSYYHLLNEKIAEMAAANERFKGRSANESTKPTDRIASRISQFVKQSKLKAYGIVDRFTPKRRQDQNVRKDSSELDEYIEEFHRQVPGVAEAVERHRKNQDAKNQVVDNSHFAIPRKPVGTERKVGEGRAVVEDPFADPKPENKTETKFENRLRKGSISSSASSIIPGGAEALSLEEMLTANPDGFLTATSVASSTPRERRVEDRAWNGSPTKKKPTKLARDVNAFMTGPSIARVQSSRPTATGLIPTLRGSLTTVPPHISRALQIGERNTNYVAVSPPGSLCKRHPSPSRDVLESMVDALNNAREVESLGIHVEEDELASSFVDSQRTGARGNDGRAIYAPPSNSRPAGTTRPGVVTGPHTTRNGLAISSSNGNVVRRGRIASTQRAARAATGNHALHGDPQEIDELQQDEPAYHIDTGRYI